MTTASNDESAASSSGLGSRSHIRLTLERAREAIRMSRARAARSRDLIATASELAESAHDALISSTALRAQLRASVTAYVRHLKHDGLPPERMLVQVKSAVRDATPPELDHDAAKRLMEDVVRWSVEAYYHAA